MNPLALWAGGVAVAGVLWLHGWHTGTSAARERAQVRIAELAVQRTLAEARAVALAELNARLAADLATEAEGIARDVEAQPDRDCVCLSADIVRRLNRP